MTAKECQKWCVVRLVTVKKRNEENRLLFATLTELTPGRPAPTRMSGADDFRLKASGERLFFRRTILSKEDAIGWYRSLKQGVCSTPVPTRKEDQETSDGCDFLVPRLEDAQPWPEFGLPINEELFSNTKSRAINPAPFLGSVPSRVHRRFGDRAGLETFLGDYGAQAFVARRMHVNLFEYQEYLGSAVYIAPDPVIRQIDHFMVPAKDGKGERIIYRIVPHPGESLEHVRVTAFDQEARMLTSFKTYRVPSDGILEVDKGTCMGAYGYVVTHEQHGVLAYQPSSSFLRQMNLNLRVSSGKRLKVNVPLDDSADSPRIEYEGARESELASSSVIGEVIDPGFGVRVAAEASKRQRLAEAKRSGQRWFDKNSRPEAMSLIQELLRGARTRVIIADPYLGALQLSQFLYSVHGSEVSVTLLTTKLALTSNTDSANSKGDAVEEFERNLENLKKHQKLSPDVRVLSSSSLHDRFLVIDDDVWFVGNSLNSLGTKGSMIVKLPDPHEVVERLRNLAAAAPTLSAHFSKSMKTKSKRVAE